MPNKLYVNEIFKSIQGEGPSVGTPALFLRLSGCPLHCLWCDSAYTWRFSEKQPHNSSIVYDKEKERNEYLVVDLIKKLIYFHCAKEIVSFTPFLSLLVITGGEPLSQRIGLEKILDGLKLESEGFNFHRVEIETSGILDPLKVYLDEESHWVSYNVSPKLESSGNSLQSRYNPQILRKFCCKRKSIFKFVVTCKDDLREINYVVREANIPSNLVYLMPEGNTKEIQCNKMTEIVNYCIENNFNFSPRLHVLIWDNKRGV